MEQLDAVWDIIIYLDHANEISLNSELDNAIATHENHLPTNVDESFALRPYSTAPLTVTHQVLIDILLPHRKICGKPRLIASPFFLVDLVVEQFT